MIRSYTADVAFSQNDWLSGERHRGLESCSGCVALSFECSRLWICPEFLCHFEVSRKPVCTGSHWKQLPQSILQHIGTQQFFHHTHPSSRHLTNEISRLSVLGTDEVSHGLGLALEVVRAVRAVVDVVAVGIVAVVAMVVVVALGRADVVHLVDGAALGAALDGAVAGAGEPDDDVGVGRVTGAAKVLLVTEGLDGDRVVDGAWIDVSACALGIRNGMVRCAWSVLRL